MADEWSSLYSKYGGKPTQRYEGQESAIKEANGVKLFKKDKPSMLIFGSKMGKLILTNKNLIFLSSGGSGILSRLGFIILFSIISYFVLSLFMGSLALFTAIPVGSIIGFFLSDRITTKIGFLSTKKEGSLTLPLMNITYFGSIGSLRMSYLLVKCKGSSGIENSYSFVIGPGIERPKDWEDSIASLVRSRV